MNTNRALLLLWLALLSSCTTYGASGYYADALSADDPYWRDAAEDPLGCADTESCRIAGPVRVDQHLGVSCLARRGLQGEHGLH
jgi:hypothetical protein